MVVLMGLLRTYGYRAMHATKMLIYGYVCEMKG
jgi:hypothetical protein